MMLGIALRIDFSVVFLGSWKLSQVEPSRELIAVYYLEQFCFVCIVTWLARDG